MITHGSPSFVSGPSGSSIGSRFAKSSAISSLLSSQSGCSELLFVLIYCLNFLLFRRLQLHKLVDHSFQTVEHDIIAEDKHLQSPFLLVQQHGLTGCARHVVDVLYGATCNLLTVELDNDRSCTATRFRHNSTPPLLSNALSHRVACCIAYRRHIPHKANTSPSPDCTDTAILFACSPRFVASGFACISAPPVVKSESTNRIHRKSRSPYLGRAFFIIENDGSLPAQTYLDHQQAKAELHGAVFRHAGDSAHAHSARVWLILECCTLPR